MNATMGQNKYQNSNLALKLLKLYTNNNNDNNNIETIPRILNVFKFFVFDSIQK